jgi:predicted nucleic acid-binding protein
VADSTPSRVIVVDANILINFLHAGRLGLLTSLPGYEWVVPEDVVSEITDAAQRQQLDTAIANQQLRVETISEPSDLVQYAELRRTLGRGEYSSSLRGTAPWTIYPARSPAQMPRSRRHFANN